MRPLSTKRFSSQVSCVGHWPHHQELYAQRCPVQDELSDHLVVQIIDFSLGSSASLYRHNRHLI
jgi:hypothetical protein